ncbi:MAG: alanine dehydrogenase [Chloroflexota bacterium]
MIIGIPKEIKDNEYRVSQTPANVEMLVGSGHRAVVERGAGEASGFTDDEYARAGGELVAKPGEVFGTADMVVKVKEPLEPEYGFLHEGLILFTYLHLASAAALTQVLQENRVVGIAYETVEMPDGSLPLLTPMSEVAGRIAAQIGAQYLERVHGGSGVLIGGVPGVPACKVVVIGGGVVGINATQVALGMGGRVTVIDKDTNRLRYLSEVLHGQVETQVSNPANIAAAVKEADVVIGAVLIHGAAAPKLLTREMVKSMKPRSVVVDVAIDQGGCAETSCPTTHSDPTYVVDGVTHYCVTNVPGAVPRTSTYALTNQTFPYVLKLANMGFVEAVRSDGPLAKGVNVYQGHITHEGVAKSLGLPYTALDDLVARRAQCL